MKSESESRAGRRVGSTNDNAPTLDVRRRGIGNCTTVLDRAPAHSREARAPWSARPEVSDTALASGEGPKGVLPFIAGHGGILQSPESCVKGIVLNLQH